MLATFYSASPAASEPCLAVFYPDIREPYRSVFTQIVSGLESQSTFNVRKYALGEDARPDVALGWVRAERCAAAVALGRRGLGIVDDLSGTVPSVVGAVLLLPPEERLRYVGISLVPDPEQMLRRLKSLAPGIRRIAVVYNPKELDWLVDGAAAAGNKMNLQLIRVPADDLHEAAIRYRETLRGIDATDTALWLPPDATTLEDKVILPLVLEESWNRKIVVFSSNPVHVERGVLFSLYPDNKAMGKSLALLAIRLAHKDPNVHTGVVPLSDLLIAVNIRTAEHLGLNFTGEQQRQFDLILPSR